MPDPGISSAATGVREGYLKRVTDLIVGWREAALIEQVIVDFCAPEVERFTVNERSEAILRRVMNSNDARANRDRYTKDADALEWVLALAREMLPAKALGQ